MKLKKLLFYVMLIIVMIPLSAKNELKSIEENSFDIYRNTSDGALTPGMRISSEVLSVPIVNDQFFCNASSTVAELIPPPSTTINWYNAPGSTTPLLPNAILTPGVYFVSEIIGGVESERAEVLLSQGFPITIAIENTSSDITCDGSLTATPTGGTAPYIYLWSDGQTGMTAFNLCIGSYTVWVTDANGCVATDTVGLSSSFTITSTDPVQNAVNVPNDMLINVDFNEPLNPNSVTLESVRQFRSNSAPQIPTDGSATAPYFPGEVITTSFTSGLMNENGASLTPFVHQFTAAVSPNSPGIFPNGQNIINSLSFASDVYIADISNNGFLDIIASTNTFGGVDQIIWYNNNGDQTFETAQVVENSALEIGELVMADLDNDQDLDILISFAGGVAWYENIDGQGTFGSFQLIGSTIGESFTESEVVAADLNGDGNLDVLTSNTVEVIWYPNNGDGTFGTEQIVGNQIASDILAADLNNDGNIDIIADEGITSGLIVWYSNNGDSTFSARQTIAVDGNENSFSDVFIADLNNDTNLDIVVTGASGLFWTPNNGNGSFGVSTMLPSNGSNIAAIHVADLDGNGSLDILVASDIAASSGRLDIYKNNNGAFTEPELIPAGVPLFFTRDITAGDLDNDGDLDIVASSSNDGLISWYENASQNPEIDVLVDEISIVNGSGTIDLELACTAITTTFTIDNSEGNAPLELTGTAPNFVTLSGSEDFSITAQPDTATIAVGATTTFEITYTPALTGAQSVTVSIANNDPDESPFTFTITALPDGESPEITCPENITVNNDVGSCDAQVSLIGPEINDNCIEGVFIITDAPATGVFPVGTTIVTWTAVDAAGNEASCEQMVTVIDNESPEITCADTMTVNNDPETCGAEVTLTFPDVIDNCMGDITVTNDAPEVFPLGTTIVTWTAVDAVGNEASCEQMVTVIDNESPEITCADTITVNNDPETCSAEVTLTSPDVIDNCMGDITVTNDAPEVFPVGTTIVTWTAVDTAGNEAACEQTVTVVDAEAPTLDCPDDTIVVGVDEVTGLYTVVDFVAEGLVIISDNCDNPVSIVTQTPAIGTQLSGGDSEVMITAQDEAGNSETCTFALSVDETLSVVDETALNAITIYPNPASSTVILTNEHNLKLDQVSIYDLRGRLVQQVDLSNMNLTKTLNVASLKDALYFLVINADGRSITKRLVVRR